MWVSYPSGNSLDKSIRLCQTAYALELLVRGVLVAPAQVFLDRAGEQHVLLEHHGNLIAQRLDVVIAHIHAADLDRAAAWHRTGAESAARA